MEKPSIMIYFSIILSLFSAFHGAYAQHTLIVAKDGSGEFTTLSQAVAAAPNHSSTITYIKIRAGFYNEYVVIPKSKVNLYFLGDGMDNTIISGNKSANPSLTTYYTATVMVLAGGFVAKDITFENTAGVNMNQSVALLNEGSLSAFYRCRFSGYQDTLYVKIGIQFFRDCDIYGTVDFIFGNARAFFQNCNVYARRPRQGQSNTITAQKRDSAGYLSGIVMQNCTVAAASDLFGVRTYLGRPWGNYSITVVMQSRLDALIDPNGWLEWPPRRLDSLFYAEYLNQGEGADTSHRVGWARRNLSDVEAKRFTAREFVEGEKWLGATNIPYYLDFCDHFFVKIDSLCYDYCCDY